ASTYTGANSFTGSGVFQIGTSSNSPFTAGPFGTGTITINNTTNAHFQAVKADQTVANTITLTTGFIADSASAAQDPTGPHSLTFSGPITLGTASRNITNNTTAPAAFILGSAASPSTITLSTTTALNLGFNGAGITIINDVIQDPTPAPATPTSVSVGTGGQGAVPTTVVNFNAVNTYAGATAIGGNASGTGG